MLANNICDLKRDIEVKRHTLPYYIGVKKAVSLYARLYYLTYAAMTAMVILKILSPICLISLFSIIPVQRNINAFLKKQEKAETFITAIKNFILIMDADTVMIFISALI
jgi:1,4-dihydroxy-2-naphthoate octaprenyltransferase